MTQVRLPPAGDYSHLGIQAVPPGTAFYRISGAEFPSSLHFATGSHGRFNASDGSYGVLYVAESLETAFCETFGHGVADKYAAGAAKFVGEKQLREKALFRITATRELSIAEFYGAGLVRLNLDARFCGKVDYTESQAWSRWTYDHNHPLDGLTYHSRHLPNTGCFALFDRCKPHLREERLGVVRNLPQLWTMMERLGWGFVDET